MVLLPFIYLLNINIADSCSTNENQVVFGLSGTGFLVSLISWWETVTQEPLFSPGGKRKQIHTGTMSSYSVLLYHFAVS